MQGRSFRGDFRAFRISSEARYSRKFTPPTVFKLDKATVLLLDFSKLKNGVLPDLAVGAHDGALGGARYVPPKK